MPISGGPIWLAGCGAMAGAMLGRWLESGLDPARVTVVRPSGKPVAPDVRVATAPPADAPSPALLMLGFKPQMLAEAALPFMPFVGAQTTVLSILAGVDTATLGALYPHARAIVRVMPNLPVAIGQGVVMLHALGDAALRHEIAALLAPLGLIEWIEDETRYDAYTALAGCGTGFAMRFIDALAGGGIARGIAPAAAARLALATVAGTSAYVAAGSESPAALAGRVASRGGSTQAGYDVLDRDDALVRLMTETVAAAERRNAELGAAARAAANLRSSRRRR